MHFTGFSVLLFSGVATVVARTEQTKRDASQPYFDIYQGPNEQDSIINDPSTQLDYTLSAGEAFPNPYMVDRLGTTGPLLISSTSLIEQLAHFVRERVPERTVHAKGAGAHGWFEVTTPVAANYSMAKVFSDVGKRTPVTARFSTIAGNLGNADTVRDLRGLAFKLRTEDGILDWPFLNHPVFWLRDPAKFPHFIHSQKRNPQTNTLDHNNFWDYLSANNESIYQTMRTMSDLGTPYGFRHMNGFSGNAFRAVKADGSWVYIKTSAYTDQGIMNNTNDAAITQAGTNPDFGVQDLYDSIAAGNYPSWTIYWQTMTAQEAANYKYDPLDLTKEWLVEDIPLKEIGRITLVQNPTNHFSEVEQIGFDPANLPYGLEPSEDPTLQARLFAYADAQRYRTGINGRQLPINCPLNPVANFVRDGAMSFNNQGKRPNFWSQQDMLQLAPRPYNDDNYNTWTGGVVKYLSSPSEIDFDQPRIFWNGLSERDQNNLIYNVVSHLGQASDMAIRLKQCQIFYHVNETLGQAIAAGVNITL
ncbi:catalase-like domain-containing protein [Suillus clintonianus]|uniref:catalase-like domain-containing protein n=1 Tax=Suillus clintonianus TaxID=1904413 RepID=UPI001B88688C|nr:catalase-like domain-containing protein [Suillus clintonianus]KAG2142959.1 catalase-like domain-containing protein [Suillus clintonianus]